MTTYRSFPRPFGNVQSDLRGKNVITHTNNNHSVGAIEYTLRCCYTSLGDNDVGQGH